MRNEILARQVAAMKVHGLDAMISCSPENFAYASGFVVPSQSLIRHRHAIVIVTSDGTPAILAVDMEATTVRGREPDTKTEIWAEFTDDCMAMLARLLTTLGLERSLIGIEMDYLPAGDMVRLQGFLPAVRFKPDDAILARLRQVKTKDEIALLRRLSLIADQAIAIALRSISVESSEMDIAAALTRSVYSLGAEQFKLMIVATGERSQLPNVGPSKRRLQARDVCRVEIFPVIDGYQAGVCRTAAVREAPPHAEEIWQNLVDCKYIIMEMIKPGASCREIYAAFSGQLSKLNLPPISFVGHGIGLHLHEEPYIGMMPMLGRSEDALLEAGMVLGIEPLCYRTGYGFGMQNKDMMLVTETGCELLSSYLNTDALLVVG